MLDPKTLKSGDVVVFGGKVEKTVDVNRYELLAGITDYVVFKGEDYITSHEDSIWQIAELKAKPLPKFLGNYDCGIKADLVYSKHYHFPIGGWWPESVLEFCKIAIKQLEEAGVK